MRFAVPAQVFSALHEDSNGYIEGHELKAVMKQNRDLDLKKKLVQLLNGAPRPTSFIFCMISA